MGYDSRANHEAVIERDAIPIIAIRKTSKREDERGLREGVSTQKTPALRASGWPL